MESSVIMMTVPKPNASLASPVVNAGVSCAAAACSPVLRAPDDFTVDEVKRDHPFACTLGHGLATPGTTTSSYGST